MYFVEELSELVVLKEEEPEMMQIADANDEVRQRHNRYKEIDLEKNSKGPKPVMNI